MSNDTQQTVCAQPVGTGGLLQRVAVSMAQAQKRRSAERCSAWLKVRTTPELKRRLEKHAQCRGVEFSAWVRRALKLQADREASYLPPPPLDIDPRDAAIMKNGRMDATDQTEDA